MAKKANGATAFRPPLPATALAPLLTPEFIVEAIRLFEASRRAFLRQLDRGAESSRQGKILERRYMRAQADLLRLMSSAPHTARRKGDDTGAAVIVDGRAYALVNFGCTVQLLDLDVYQAAGAEEGGAR